MVRPLRDDLRISPTELGHVLDRIKFRHQNSKPRKEIT